MFSQTTALVFLTVFIASYWASPLSSIDEVRELLLEIRGLDEEENALDEAVMDIVDRVYSPELRTRYARKEGDKCQNGWTATCANEKCQNGKCRALCDSMKLGNKEKYQCRCDKGYTGAYCNVTKSPDLCKDCAGKCYKMQQSKTGFFCFDDKFHLLNPDAKVSDRSLEEMSEMAQLSDIVTKIMTRQLDNPY